MYLTEVIYFFNPFYYVYYRWILIYHTYFLTNIIILIIIIIDKLNMFDLYDYIIFIFLFKNVFVVSFLTSSSENIVSGSLNVVVVSNTRDS